MAHEAAFILDQLMGRNRDVVPGEGNENDRNWSDPDVCKYHLCGFCPSELFTNTRSDVGPCDKIHDPLLKKSYEESDRRGKMGYEDDFLEYLESLIRDLDRRIQRGKNRLQLSVSANVKAMGMDVGLLNSEKMKELASQINELVTKSEELGNLGHIEEAQELIREVERLDKEKERERSNLLLKANVPHTVAGYEMDPGNFHEKMEMCDLCGCFLVIGDSQSRIDAHLMGKQHMGFSRIRNTIAELKNKRQEESVKRREERMRRSNRSISPRGSRDRGRDREQRGHRRSRSSSRERSRRRERGRRSRSRSRDRRRRSRSRERRNRSRGRRSRSRDRRSRSRDRRSRSRERRNRSRERRGQSKERREKRDRSRNRSRERKEHRDRSRERRNRSRERRRKSRSRSRDRRRSRSRSRERKRSRSRERKRSRSRERKRSRSRERRRKQSQESDQSKSKDRHHSQSKDHHHGRSRERLSSNEHKEAAVRSHSSERERRSSAEDEENGGKSEDRKDSSTYRSKSELGDDQGPSEDKPRSHCNVGENGCKGAMNTSPEGIACGSLNNTTSSVPECSEEEGLVSA